MTWFLWKKCKVSYTYIDSSALLVVHRLCVTFLQCCHQVEMVYSSTCTQNTPPPLHTLNFIGLGKYTSQYQESLIIGLLKLPKALKKFREKRKHFRSFWGVMRVNIFKWKIQCDLMLLFFNSNLLTLALANFAKKIVCER